jgi:microsomal dipeptidase-like Zn-dependent dipeptidase
MLRLRLDPVRQRLARWIPVAALMLAGTGCSGTATDSDPVAPAVPESPTPPPADPPVREPPPAPTRILAIDTHSDTTQRMLDEDADLSQRLPDGHVDLVRMQEGGLGGVFLSIWVDPRKYRGERAWRRTLSLIGAVEELVRDHPEQAALCTTGAEVRAAFAAGKAAILMGVEGAHGLGTSDVEEALDRTRQLYRRGVRYMTITWSTDNDFGHSSTGRQPLMGLTDAGRSLVAELNTLGMIVDVSHVSDATFEDILGITTRPVLASHSSCRDLAAHPRNVTDAMIRPHRQQRRGGVPELLRAVPGRGLPLWAAAHTASAPRGVRCPAAGAHALPRTLLGRPASSPSAWTPRSATPASSAWPTTSPTWWRWLALGRRAWALTSTEWGSSPPGWTTSRTWARCVRRSKHVSSPSSPFSARMS